MSACCDLIACLVSSALASLSARALERFFLNRLALACFSSARFFASRGVSFCLSGDRSFACRSLALFAKMSPQYQTCVRNS